MPSSKQTIDLQKLRAAAIEIGKQDFYSYCRLRLPVVYTPERKHLKALCDDLQSFIESDDEGLILNMPPRHGKTLTVELLCEWLLGKDPTFSVIAACYNETLSGRFAKAVRSGIQEKVVQGQKSYSFGSFFPNTNIKLGDGAMNLWSLEGSHFSFLATSPGGTATGLGGQLLVIDDLIKNAIEAYNERILEEHWSWYCFIGETKISTKNGYKEIKDICAGDYVLSYNHNKCIIEEKKVLRSKSKESDIYTLRFDNGKEVRTTGNHRFYTSEGYKSVEEILHSMWGEVKQGETLLFSHMQVETLSKAQGNDDMQRVWKRDSTGEEKQAKSFLFFGMPMDKQEEELCYSKTTMAQDKNRDEEEIFRVPEVRREKESACTPYRSQHNEQRNRKSSGSLPIVPYRLSQVTRLSRDDIREVYDIEVEGNHNFFAETMLVHNCDTMLSRIESGGKQIVIQTRWSNNDLSGRLIELHGDKWRTITMPAYDGKKMLCPDMLNFETYSQREASTDKGIFQANYNQKPFDQTGSLYGEFNTYSEALTFERIEAYVDTADTGADYLSGAVYGVLNGLIYILDIIYTQEPMEQTEPATAKMLTSNRCGLAHIESNNGGRGFARNVERIMRSMGNGKTRVNWFHQSENKRARILSNATAVRDNILFPSDWLTKWPDFARSLAVSKEAKWIHDDSLDMLTGIYEKTILTPKAKPGPSMRGIF